MIIIKKLNAHDNVLEHLDKTVRLIDKLIESVQDTPVEKKEFLRAKELSNLCKTLCRDHCSVTDLVIRTLIKHVSTCCIDLKRIDKHVKAVEYTQYKVLPIITQVNAHLRSFRELLEYYNPTKEYNVQSAKPIVKPSATKCVEESVKKYQRVEIPLSPIRLKYGATRAFRLEEIEHTDPVLDEAKEIDWEYPDAGSNIPPDYFPENIDSEG